VLGQGQVAPELLQMRGHDCPSDGLWPCGVSSLTLSVIAIATSTQLNIMILGVVIALGPANRRTIRQGA